MDAWYVIYSKARQEKEAFFNLSRQGFTVYFPQLRQNRRRKAGSTIEPAFPRYLFIRLDDETDNWSSLRSTRGVCNLVRFGDVPARVPDSLIAALRGLENAQGIREYFEPAFRPGDHVRVSGGVLEGYEGIFESRSGQERVYLMLEAAGNHARIQIHESLVDFAGPA